LAFLSASSTEKTTGGRRMSVLTVTHAFIFFISAMEFAFPENGENRLTGSELMTPVWRGNALQE
jgi:hypothetical protein